MADLINTLDKLFKAFKTDDAVPATIITNLKADAPAAEDKKLIDDFASCYQDNKTNGKSNFTSAADCFTKYESATNPDKFESGNAAISVLRSYVDTRREQAKTWLLPKDQQEDEIKKFDEFYNSKIKDRYPVDDTKKVTEEYKELKSFGFSRDPDPFIPFVPTNHPIFPSRYHLTVLGSTGLRLAVHGYNLFNKDDPFRADLFIPIPRLMVNPRFTGASALPLTPYEKQQRAMWNYIVDGAFTLTSLIPVAEKPEADGPVPAGVTSYTTVGPVTLPNDTWKWLLADIAFKKLESDSLANLSLKGLESATDPISGMEWLDLSLKLSLDVPKIMLASYRAQTYKSHIDRSLSLAFGDGTQCSAASESEVDLYRQQHQGTSLTDDEINKKICDGKPLGSNEVLASYKRSNDYLTWNNYMKMYMYTAMGRDLTLSGDKADRLWLSGLFAAAQPLINQLPNIKSGFNKSQLGYDYAFEAGAFGASVLALGKPELRQPLAGALDLWTDPFTVPDAFSLTSNSVFRDEPSIFWGPIPMTIPEFTLLDGILGGAKNYLIGVEHGDMFKRGIDAPDAWSKIQYMSPLILGIAAQITRGVRAYKLNHSEYSPAPSITNTVLQILDPTLYLGGVVTGALTSDGKIIGMREIALGKHGLVGGEIGGKDDQPAFTWGLNFGYGNASLGGSF